MVMNSTWRNKPQQPRIKKKHCFWYKRQPFDTKYSSLPLPPFFSSKTILCLPGYFKKGLKLQLLHIALNITLGRRPTNIRVNTYGLFCSHFVLYNCPCIIFHLSQVLLKYIKPNYLFRPPIRFIDSDRFQSKYNSDKHFRF
jgi:hypothetical protein